MSYSVGSDRPADLPIGQKWPTYAIFTCDSGQHHLFGPPELRLEGPFDERERQARALGWKWTNGERCLVLCPECAR